MNFKDLAEMVRLAQEAKEVQKNLQDSQNRQIKILEKISNTLDEILIEMRSRK